MFQRFFIKLSGQPIKDCIVLISRRLAVQILHADGICQINNRCNTKAFRENPLICAVQITYMKPRILILFFFFLMALGCSKDQNSSKPSLKMKSYTDLVPPDGNFTAI